MKKFMFLIISVIIAMTLSSAVQISSENSKSITLQSTGKKTDQASLKQSADIFSSRLKQFGINSFEVNISADKGQLKILLPVKTDISEIEGLLTSNGAVAFYETYTQIEITDLFKPDNQLFKLLNHNPETTASDPRIGCTTEDKHKTTDSYLHSETPVRNCRLLWGSESKKSEYCLFALKTVGDGRPLLVRTDIESVKIVKGSDANDIKIQIRLKPEAISIFAEATKSNLNKSIAIVIDDKVYSWPVVKSAIEGGEIEVTGTFTEKEANYFPVLFNSELLPLSFKLLK